MADSTEYIIINNGIFVKKQGNKRYILPQNLGDGRLSLNGDIYKSFNEVISEQVFGKTIHGTDGEKTVTIPVGKGCTVYIQNISVNTTFVFNAEGIPSVSNACFSLVLTNAGSKTITWPSGIRWPNDKAPSLTINGDDVLTFLTPDGGTTWYGAAVALNLGSGGVSTSEENDGTFDLTLSGQVTGTANINGTDATINTTVNVPNIAGDTTALTGTEIDVSTAACFTKTISEATTFTFTMGSLKQKTVVFSLLLTNGGSATITWPTSVKWSGGTVPTLTASGVDLLTFLTPDGGTTWYGSPSLIGAA